MHICPCCHVAGARLLPLDVGYLLLATQVPTALLRFSDLGRGVFPHGWPSEAQLPLLTLDVEMVQES